MLSKVYFLYNVFYIKYIKDVKMKVNLELLEGEVFVPLTECGERYLISNYGRVYSLPHCRSKVGKLLIGDTSGGERYKDTKFKVRYRRYMLRTGQTAKRQFAHRLVMKYFGTEQPSKEHQINHIDNNGLNNHISNLEWVTAKENTAHKIKQGRGRPDKAREAFKKATKVRTKIRRKSKLNFIGESWNGRTVVNVIFKNKDSASVLHGVFQCNGCGRIENMKSFDAYRVHKNLPLCRTCRVKNKI